MRPVMKSSPWWTKPRSPVRRNGPSPLSAKRALKDLLGHICASPVPACNAGAGYPDLADLSVGVRHARLRIRNHHPLIRQVFTTPDKRLPIRRVWIDYLRSAL